MIGRILLVLLLLTRSALAALPSIDASGVRAGGCAGGSVDSVVLTTPSANAIILLHLVNVVSGGPANHVLSVSGGGLTWALRSSAHIDHTADGFMNGLDSEFWWAYAASPLTSQTITVTWSAGGDMGIEWLAGLNMTSFITPFDANGSLPATATGFSDVGSVTMATSTSNDILVIGCATATAGSNQCTGTAGFTKVGNGCSLSSLAGQFVTELDYQIVSVVQPSQSFPIGGGTANGWIGLGDALAGIGGGPTPPTPNVPQRPFAHGWPW